jgi:GTPase SAR1 family protein
MNNNYDDYSVSGTSEDSSSYNNSEYYQDDPYEYNDNSKEKFRVYNSILKDLKLKIISKPEETLSIEKSRRKQSLFQKNNILEYKFLVIGDNLSGKTSFCLKFSQNKFNLETKPSTDIDCYLKTLMLFDKEIKIYLIDINDNLMNNYKNIQNVLYNNVKGVFALYDVTKRKTFEKTLKLIKDLREKIGNVIPILLVGNKNDLKNLKCIDIVDAKIKSKGLRCNYRESNCVDEDIVNETVKYFVASIYYNDLDDLEKDKIKNEILIKESNRKKKNQNL